MAQREKAEEGELQLTDPRSRPLCINNCESRPLTRPLTRPDPIRAVELEQRGAEERTAGDVTRPMDAAAATAAAATKKVNRCLKCGKRVGLTGFRCRCGDLFCGDHRYSDRHGCGYDYKAVERERIQRENPAVRAAKVVRI